MGFGSNLRIWFRRGGELVRHCDSRREGCSISNDSENDQRREAGLARHEYSRQRNARSRPSRQYSRAGRARRVLPGNDGSIDEVQVKQESPASWKLRGGVARALTNEKQRWPMNRSLFAA